MLYEPTIKALRRLLDTNGQIGATPQQLVVLAREWELRFRAQMGQRGMKVDTFNVFCDQLETIFNAIFEVVGDTPTPELEDLLLEKISVDFEALDAFYSNEDKEVQHGDTRFLTDAHFLQLREALEMHDSQYRASGATVRAPSAPALAQSAPPVPVAEAVSRMPPPVPRTTAPQPAPPAPQPAPPAPQPAPPAPQPAPPAPQPAPPAPQPAPPAPQPAPPAPPAPVTEAAPPGPIAQPVPRAPAAQPTRKPAPPAPMVAPSPASLPPMRSNVATTQETFNFPPTIDPGLIGSRAAPPLVQASVVGDGPKVLPRAQSAAPPGPHAPARVPVRSQSTAPAVPPTAPTPAARKITPRMVKAKGEPATAQNVHYQPPVRSTTHGGPPAPTPNPVKSTSTRRKICSPEMVVDDDDDDDERNPAPGTVPSMAGPTTSADAPFTLIPSAQPFYTFPPSGEFVPMDPLNGIPVGYDTFPTGAFVSPAIVPPLNGQPSYANAEVQPVDKNLGLQCDYCISQSVVCCPPPPPGIKAGRKERPKEACQLCAQRKRRCTYNGKQKDTKGKSQGKSDASGDIALDAKSETRSDIIDMTDGDSSKAPSVVEVEEDEVRRPLEVARERKPPAPPVTAASTKKARSGSTQKRSTIVVPAPGREGQYGDLYAISDEALAARLQQAEKTCNALRKELAEVHQEVKQMKTQMNSQRAYVAESMLRVYDHVATHMSAMTRDMVGVQKVVNAEGRYTEGLNDLLEKVVVYMGKAPPGLFLRAVGPEGQHLRDGMLEGVGTSQGDADAPKQFKKGKKRAVDEPADEAGASSSKRARGI